MELISREAVEKLIDKYIEKHDTRKKPLFTAFSYDIDMLPTIEFKQKGKWIKNEYDWYYHCSVCKENNLLHTDEANALSNYCPNCGADMRGEE